MALATQINTKAEHQAALTRLREIFHAEAGTPEGEEHVRLAEAISDYETRTIEWGPTDGVDALEFELDRGKATLDAVLDIFGGEDGFAAYMLRERDVAPETARQLSQLLDLPLEDFTCPFRQDAAPDDALIGGTPWRDRLEQMVARRTLHEASLQGPSA